MLIEQALSDAVVGALIEVHRVLGPGLLESVYRRCFCRELELRGLKYRCEVALPIDYKGLVLDCGYRMDVVVEETIVIELKSVNEMNPVFEAQLLTYLKRSGLRVGYIANFNVPRMLDGLRRMVR